MSEETVSVLMPTRAMRHRGALLRRALESVLAQEEVRAVPVVVINGRDHDPELTGELRKDRRLRVAMRDKAGLPAALHHGRELVDTRWFAELDDDDVLLPGALAVRLRALRERPDLDAVITNGIRRRETDDTFSIPDVRMIEPDPLRALVLRRHYWLLPGSWLCRTDAIGPEFFREMPPYRECTYLALRLAATRRIGFLGCPTVIWHADTPLSESKSRDYALAGPAAITRMLELDLPADVRVVLRGMLSRQCHVNAHRHLTEGRVEQAWRWHLRSLLVPGGWRRLPYTRRLLYALLRS
jgi:hypothetical protein